MSRKPRIRKFLVGEPFTDPVAVLVAIMRGEWLIFNGHKPIHPSWSGGWSVHLVRSFVFMGLLRRAILNPEYKPKEPEE